MNWNLETGRIGFRNIVESDAQNLSDLNSDPAVTMYLGIEPTSLEAMVEIVQKIMVRDLSYQNQLGLFMAIEKSSGVFIGWFILRPGYETPQDRGNLEIGWRLKQQFWGKGFGTEGALALKEHAKKMGARRLFATAMSANAASIRIMEKLGLTLERAYIDTDEYWHKPTEVVEYATTFV